MRYINLHLHYIYMSETVPANNQILQAVWQGIPDRRTSHTESRSAVEAELVAWYD